MSGAYQDAFMRSIENPNEFWAEAAKAIDWFKPFEKVLDESNAPFYRWFTGGEMNTCYNAVDRHVENGHGGRTALIYDSPVTGCIKKYTYSELKNEVSRFAGGLRKLGVEKGDRVVIYMPMIPEGLIAMLACARLGAIHSVVFGGFAANELAVRIDDAKPKVVVTATCGIEVNKVIEYMPLLNGALDRAKHKPDHVVVRRRPQAKAEFKEGRDVSWADLVDQADPVECVSVSSTDPLYILYTSGTTGVPKGVVRHNGGHAVSLTYSMKYIYGIEEGDVFWSASDIGWVVGHSYICYAPLLMGCTTVVFEGKPIGTPDAGTFWRVVSEHKVKVLFTAPTAFRAIKKEDPLGEYRRKYDLEHFKALFLAGERTDPDTYYWAKDLLDVPVIDHWWQTETGWPMASNFRNLEYFLPRAGSATRPVPGFDVRILDEDGQEAARGESGAVVIKLPLPPGCLPTLWQDQDRYEKAYLSKFPGYYLTGDGGFIDKDGYVFIMGRIDDVIITAGHNMSTGSIEESIAAHPDVADCAVIGAADPLKTQVPVGLLVLKGGVDRQHDEIVKEVVQRVRNDVGAVANFRQAVVVQRLPKTRSGKILRGVMRKIADGLEYKAPSTIDDPAILDEIDEALQSIGYAKKASDYT